MKESKIIQFKKDDKFYFKKGSEFLASGNLEKAVCYILKAIDLVENKNMFLKGNYYIVLAQCYALLNMIELSNFYYYCALENEIFAQVVFRGLAENFLQIGDNINARFYLNSCINLCESSQVAQSAQERLKNIDNFKDNGRKLKVVFRKEENLNIDDITKIDKFMSKGKFDDAISILEKSNNFEDDKVRSELSLAYFFSNETDKALELLNKYGKNNLNDLCNLLLIYYCKNDLENYDKTKSYLLEMSSNSKVDEFKIGLTFAETNEFDLSKKFMKNYIDKNKFSNEFSFLFAISCINNRDFEEAKSILISLKKINIYNNYIYDYYISCCNFEFKERLEYVFNIPVREYLKVQNEMKECLVLDEETLLKKFLDNKDFFYFLSSLQDSTLKNSILLKLSLIENDILDDFFKFVLLLPYTKNSIKNKIALNRLCLNSSSIILLVKDGIFFKFTVPNMLATKNNSKCLFEATKLALEYLLYDTFIMNVNLKKEIIKMERIIKNEDINPYVLASFIIWDYTKAKKIAPLSKICKHFSINQEEFYNFVNQFNLDV